MDKNKVFPKVGTVLNYAKEYGRKLEKTKLYEDIKAGLLPRQKDGSFRALDVERYMASLPMLETPASLVIEAQDLQVQKQQEEIRRLRAVADREEFDLDVKRGKYLPKDMVYQEQAARVVVLATGLKSVFEARISEIITRAHGDMKEAPGVVGLLHEMLDLALNEYSRDMEFEVEFVEGG